MTASPADPQDRPTGGTAPALLSDAALAEIRERHAETGRFIRRTSIVSRGIHADRAALLSEVTRLREIVTAICGDLEQAARVADQMKGCEHRWRPGALGLGCQYCGEPLPVGDAMKGETK